MEMTEIKNFTLLVPCRDRQYNIPRLFDYYSSLKCEKLLVDGSKEPFTGSIPNDWKYFHFPSIHYLDRMRMSLEMVKTEFVQELPDDDAIVLPVLKSCVDFLQEHPDFSVCDGEVYEFDRNKKTFQMKYAVSLNRVIRDKTMNDGGIWERLENHFHHTVFPRNHSVLRTKLVKKAFDTITALGNEHLRSMNILDRFLTMTLLIHGKFNTIEQPLYIRQVGDRLIDRPEIDTIWSRKEFQENLDFNHLHHLAEMIGGNIEQNVERIKNILNRHFARVLPILGESTDRDFSTNIEKHFRWNWVKVEIDRIREMMLSK